MMGKPIGYKGVFACALLSFLLVVASGQERAHAQDDVVVRQEKIQDNFPEQEISSSSMSVGNGKREAVDVPVISWRDMPFQTVKKQGLDYSCGSAALSTLLTYVYDTKTSEGAVFKAMFDGGDQDNIRREGFSLLDMSKYLNSRGFKAVGYKVNLDTMEKNKVPFIALINDNGYNHFVVVKSIKGQHLLVGDPNKGNVIHYRASFEKAWNGIALVVTNRAKAAHAFFDKDSEWRYAHRLADPAETDYAGLDSTVLQPIPWQIAPMNTDLLGSLNIPTADLVQHFSSGIGGVP